MFIELPAALVAHQAVQPPSAARVDRSQMWKPCEARKRSGPAISSARPVRFNIVLDAKALGKGGIVFRHLARGETVPARAH